MNLVAPTYLYSLHQINQRDAMKTLLRAILSNSDVSYASYNKTRQKLEIIFGMSIRNPDQIVDNDHQGRLNVGIFACENAFARLCGCTPAAFIVELKRQLNKENNATLRSNLEMDAWLTDIEEIFQLRDFQDSRLNFSTIEWREVDQIGHVLMLGALVIAPQTCKYLPIAEAA